MLETYLRLLDTGYYEAKFAFEGLADENVWKRPAPGLLSVGELAAHVVYWEAVKFACDHGTPAEGDEESSPLVEHRFSDLAKCKVSSPLIDHRFSYLPNTLASSPSPEHLAMTAEQVCRDFVRVHEETVAHLKALNPDLDSVIPGWRAGHTYRMFLEYAIFHVAYHTGQMYSVRHLLGDTTPDN
jgi:hypothetical protein